MPSAKFPINVNLESIDGTIDRSKIVNGYAEVASAQESKVYNRPALALAQGSFATFGMGMAFTPDDQLYVVSGGNIYTPVAGQSFGVNPISTFGTALVVAHPFGNSIYGIQRTSPFGVYKSSYPYTSWSTLGTGLTGTGQVISLTSHGGYLVANMGTSLIHSQNGSTWGTASFGPGVAGVSYSHLYSMGGTLYWYQPIDNNRAFYYTTDTGNTAWADGTVVTTATGSQTTYYATVHNNKLWALSAGTNVGVWNSANGINWSLVTSPNQWASVGSVQNNDCRVASSGVGMVGVFARGVNNYEIWSSDASGTVWNLTGTGTSPIITGNSIRTFSISGALYSMMDDSNQTYVFAHTSAGTLQGLTAVSSISVPSGEGVSIVGSETVTFVKSTVEAYTVTGGAWTKVSSANYPATTVRGAVYLNGHLYVMEPDATIWASADGNFTTWAGTDFIVAELEADGGVAIAKQNEYVIAFGQFTTEAFYDAGNATGSPLSPVSNAVMLIGCVHANSVAQLESSLIWVAQQKAEGSTFNKGRFVVVMKGYGSYERISTPDVERVLDADAFSEVYAAVLTISGHVFYVISMLDTDITLVYDFRSQLWYEWTLSTVQSAKAVTSISAASQLATAILASHGYADGDQVVVTGGTGTFTAVNGTYNVNKINAGTFTYPITGTLSGTSTTGTGQGWTEGAMDVSASCYFDNSQLVQLRTTGDIYVLDGTGVTDNGAPIDFRIRTKIWDGGSNREKFAGALEVVGDKVASTGLVRYSDDEFASYSKFKRVDLSLRRPRSRRGGTFSTRAVEFRHTLPFRVGIRALEADIEAGEQ